MIVVKHKLMCLKVETLIILCVLAERDRCVLVNDATDLCDHPWLELLIVLVSDDPDVFAYRKRKVRSRCKVGTYLLRSS